MNTLAAERNKAEILRRLKAVRPDSSRPLGTDVGAPDDIRLTDASRMATAVKPVSRASGMLQRTVVKWIALYTPLPWPSGILTRPEIDQEAGGTCPSDFAADVAELEALVEVLTAEKRSFEWPSHPIFGRMSEADWLRWAYLHMDHHLRQFGA